jgi:hypothetical protein
MLHFSNAGQIQVLATDESGNLRVIWDDADPVEGLIPAEKAALFTWQVGHFVTLAGELSVRESDGRVILTAEYWMQNP